MIVKKHSDWKEYEMFVMRTHQERTGEITFHWDETTDDILIDSGWALYPELLQRMRLNSKLGRHREYGADGISYYIHPVDGHQVFNIIQAKMRNGRQYLCASDLGTFTSCYFHRFYHRDSDSRGFVYTNTTKFQKDFREDCKNAGLIKLITLPFQEKNTTKKKSKTTQLRYYQIKALENLRKTWEGFKILNFICGTGKTITYVKHALENDLYDRIVILSPTRSLADQNKYRFDEGLDENWISMLVDSDGTDSTRNVNDIQKNWNREEGKVFISSTFHSARDVLNEVIFKPQSHINSDKTLFIVDEAHNLTSKDITMLNTCKKCLLITATPPKMLQESIYEEGENDEQINPWIEENLIYSYSLAQGIKDGYICDYEVYLPNIESKYEKEEENLVKAQFLAEGMIRKNCRRTIVYCNSTKECEEMEPLIKKAADHLHFDHELDIFTISHKTSSKERKQILDEEFPKNDFRYKIILSVKILNEGIDLVKTDSIFITKPNDEEDDWKRTIQRICRANRKDPDNPNKIARIFIWNPDTAQIPKCFQVMKEIDVNFFSKLKILNPGFYDDKMNNANTCKEFIEKEITLTEETRKIFSVKCMTVREKHDFLLTKTEEHFKKHGKLPLQKYKIPESKFGLGKWLCDVRRGVINLLQNQNERLVNLDPNFFISRIKRINIDRIVQEVIKFSKEKGRMPYKGEKVVLKDLGEINLGNFWERIKSKKNKSFTDQHREMILEVFPNAFDPCFIDKQELVDKFIEFEEKEGRWPYYEKKDKIQMNGKEYLIGLSFIRIQKNPDKFLTKDLITKLEEKDPLWRLNLTERTTLKKLEKCLEFFKKNNNNWPTCSEKNKNYPLDEKETFNIGVFWSDVKSGHTSISEISRKKILELDSTFVINKKRKREE
jgi:superfamily II DNA or RNA helicase